MTRKVTGKVVAAVSLCAAVLVAGCQAMPDGSGTATSSASEPVAAAVSTTDVLAAVQAATALQDLPSAITNDELLAAGGDYSDQWSVEGCEPPLEVSRLDDLGPCTRGDTTSDRTMALIGDSAASMWHSAFDLIGKRNGWRVLALTKSNCGPAALTYYQWQLNRSYTECDDWQDWRMATIARENAEIVVLAGHHDGGNQGPGRDTTAKVWRHGLVTTIDQLPAGTRTFLLGGIPRPAESPSECVAADPTELTRCAEPAAAALPDQSGWSGAAELTGQTFVDVDPWFCAGTCPAVIAEQLVYSGKFHLTGQDARYLSGPVEEVMAPALSAQP
ncbi:MULTISPECIES: SGNH hydrolase domain-containing protein [unclassified Gordonia (in: high G+C Gram-positive bacteria)]|uniref:SGNH hydrolase domain-containing protein n=1 Tax=unclassified Gordonia (in: high G+C Gram-positive bacteria) TaxID=2657482 RepID=UPI0010F9DFE8|nr:MULTISPECIES: SGNH hydrolase domain-containing protein [unclassified Gordonia (in: high G+C Gram-positive bacteria)]